MAIDIQTAPQGARAYTARFGQERRVAHTYRLVETGVHIASQAVGQVFDGVESGALAASTPRPCRC